VLKKPAAVIRRDIIANTAPSIYGVKRMDKVRSPGGEIYTFLGVSEGVVHLECEGKARSEPFIEVNSQEFARWRKAG